ATHGGSYAIFGHVLEQSVSVIPGWSEGPDPESRDSGFDASHRPGMTATKKCWLRSRFDTSSDGSRGIDRLSAILRSVGKRPVEFARLLVERTWLQRAVVDPDHRRNLGEIAGREDLVGREKIGIAQRRLD